MKPTVHGVSSVLGFFFISFFYPQPWSVLAGAIALTLGVDVLDHGLFIATLRHESMVKIRRDLLRGDVGKAYRFYFKNRRRILPYAFVHNLPVLIVIVFLTGYWRSVTMGLGLVLHFVLDLIDHYDHVGNLDFWVFKEKNKD